MLLSCAAPGPERPTSREESSPMGDGQNSRPQWELSRHFHVQFPLEPPPEAVTRRTASSDGRHRASDGNGRNHVSQATEISKQAVVAVPRG